MTRSDRGAHEARRRLLDSFHGLEAGAIMRRDLRTILLVPPHLPVADLLDAFRTMDHAWVRLKPDSGRRIRSIVTRRDLLRSLLPTRGSYTSYAAARLGSLAHGSADCICRFHEGRVLHAVAPSTRCDEALRVMEDKRLLYLPVLEGGELVGEIGEGDLLRAVHGFATEHGGLG